jgi:hypothetical protein
MAKERRLAPGRKSTTRLLALGAAEITGIDSAFDQATTPVFNYRVAHVYPRLAANGRSVRTFHGNMATRQHVAPELSSVSVKYVTGSGHGLENRFMGSFFDVILKVGAYAPAEAAGKIVHLLACRTAEELGPDLVSNGCLAFIGYDKDYAYFPEHVEAFLGSDAEIDFGVVSGLTVEEAYGRAITAYQKRIEAFDQQGLVDVVAALQTMQDHLCSPALHPKWGSKNARLD